MSPTNRGAACAMFVEQETYPDTPLKSIRRSYEYMANLAFITPARPGPRS